MSKTKKIWTKAKEVAKDNNRIRAVISSAKEKIQRLTNNSEEFQEFRSKLDLLLRMAKAHIAGEFKAFSWKTILLIIFGLLYFIAPLDVIPDFLPALGYSDDVSIVYFIFQKLSEDIERFSEWEIAQTKSIN
ncbi:MAG: YkvA family protein [Ekhidna sp.]